MQIQKHFSGKRFIKLFKLYWYENGQTTLISLAAFSMIIMIVLFIFQSANEFRTWNTSFFMGFFLLFYIGFGLIYGGYAFPAFRKKETTINYLLLPASAFEKYSFEFITRVVVYTVLAPCLYWLLANIEGHIAHFFFPKFKNYQFRWSEGIQSFFEQSINWEEPLIQILLLVIVGLFVVAFAGASKFRKNPLLKSVLVFGLLFGGFTFMIYLLFEVGNIHEYHKDTLLFLKTRNDPPWYVIIIFLIFPIIGLSSAAYFKLKEKEV